MINLRFHKARNVLSNVCSASLNWLKEKKSISLLRHLFNLKVVEEGLKAVQIGNLQLRPSILRTYEW